MPDGKWCSIISDKCPEQNTECRHCSLYVIYHDFLDRSYEKKEQEELMQMGIKTEEREYCENCKRYALNGGNCLGVRSRHCKRYKLK